MASVNSIPLALAAFAISGSAFPVYVDGSYLGSRWVVGNVIVITATQAEQ